MTYRTHQRRLLSRTGRDLRAALRAGAAGRRPAPSASATSGVDEAGASWRRWPPALKAVGTWHATATIQGCREACGGQGYLRANRFAALKADTDVFTTFEGDNTVLLQLVGQEPADRLPARVRRALDALGTAAFFAGQVCGTVAERSALRELLGRIGDDLLPGRDDEGDLLERETQLDAMRWREEHVKSSARPAAAAAAWTATRDPFELLIDCQDHLVLAARAYVERVVLEAFADAVERGARGRAARAARPAVRPARAVGRSSASAAGSRSTAASPPRARRRSSGR